MSTQHPAPLPPLPVGALFRFGLGEIRQRIYAGVVAAGFDDLRPSHVTLFRWPGPDGRRPTEIAADVQISKQRANDLIRDLEQLGYLRLQVDTRDNRARSVRLTARGKRLHRIAIRIHSDVEAEWARKVGGRCYRQMCETIKAVVSLPERSPRR